MGRSAQQRRLCLPTSFGKGLTFWLRCRSSRTPSVQEGINTELKSKPGSVAVSALAAILIYFLSPLPLAPSTHATQLLPLDQTGLNLKRTRRHFVISEISSSLFSSLWRQLAAGSEPRAVRGPTARGETRSAFTFRSTRGLHPNIYCTHGVINLPALSSRRCRSCVKAESLRRR